MNISEKNLNSIFKILDCGNINVRLYIILENGEKVYPDIYKSQINEKDGTASFFGYYNKVLKDCLYLNFEGSNIICKRILENISNASFVITELGIEFSGISFDVKPIDDYFYHHQNPRRYNMMTMSVDDVGNERIGSGASLPFPAILVSNYNTKKGLVHGSLSQKTFFHNYIVMHKNNDMIMDVLSSFKGIDNLELISGRVLIDEWYMGVSDEADDIEKVFSPYTKVLRKKLPSGYGRADINRSDVVWGTWNDGMFRNISEDLIIREAQFLKENFPTVKWIQIDDGYAVFDKIAHGLGVPFEGEDGIDKRKFPNGMRGCVDKIRTLGLRPAIWMGAYCPKETKIYKDHPEWFSDYDYRINYASPLDVSNPEVREYMEKALEMFFYDWGFEGVKHDFWSYVFEDSRKLLGTNNYTGYEYRQWWLNLMRLYLPKDGYFEIACDIGMGNPFLGEYVNNYRYGNDIGEGDWNKIKENFLWGTACFATHTGDMLIPNSDSIGVLPGLNEVDRMFWINYCLVTHSMVEIAGCLSRVTDKDVIKMLKKAVCNPNNGQDIYFVKYDYRRKEYCVPEIIYFKTPHFSRVENSSIMPIRTVGLFNIEEEAKKVSFCVEDLKLEDETYIMTDVWSLEQYDLCGNFEFELMPHESKLFSINKANGIQLYDSNIRINDVNFDGTSVMFEVDYVSKDASLMLNKKVKDVEQNSENIEFHSDGKSINLNICQKGMLKISFSK